MTNSAPEAEASELAISDAEVALSDLMAVAYAGRRVRLSTDPAWRATLARGREALEAALAAGVPIYGVSTGVGYTSGRALSAEQVHTFAYQIVHQHGCGLGPPFSEPEGRAIVFARLVSLAKGYSAVRPELLAALADLLNLGVIPVIPTLGSVGASGDLTPLSYVAAVLAGEREAYCDGQMLPAAEALQRAGLEPLRFVPKETLAVLNGTSAMTAAGIIAAERLARTLVLCDDATALAIEVLYGRSSAFHPTAHRLKHHPGQMVSAAAIHAALSGSGLIDAPPQAGRLIQDPYSLRCAPHVLGAARDALEWSRLVLRRELNSVNDNPIIDPASGEAIFAGNFYGGHVALSMDLLKTAAASVADLLDRQFALLVDARLNLGLPETLVGYGGCGLKALQITCSALAARAVQRAAPDSTLSRPTEVGNQDKVSMGLNAALSAGEVVSLLQQVLATELIALSNAAALREQDKFSPAGQRLLARIRQISPPLERDRRLDGELQQLIAAIDVVWELEGEGQA